MHQGNTKLLIYGLFQKGRVLAQDGASRAAKPARAARFTLDAPEHSGTIPGAIGDILPPGVLLTSTLAVIFTLNQYSAAIRTTAETPGQVDVVDEGSRTD